MFNLFRRNCCSCNCCCLNNNVVSVYSISYTRRFADVPMSIYRGSGYTQIDCCEDTLEVLQEISETLKNRCANSSNCGCSCGGCTCNRCCGC